MRTVTSTTLPAGAGESMAESTGTPFTVTGCTGLRSPPSGTSTNYTAVAAAPNMGCPSEV